MTNVTFFCPACQTYRAVEIEPVSADELNPEPWGDIVCATCGFVIATISGPPGVYRVCRGGTITARLVMSSLTTRRYLKLRVDTRAELCYNILTAKVVRLVSADFFFFSYYDIVVQRPSVVTTGSTLAGDPPRDTGGRSILNPRQATGPPKNKKPSIRWQSGFLQK